MGSHESKRSASVPGRLPARLVEGHETPDLDARATLDALRRIVRALRLGASAAERTHGLSGAQLFVLQVLREGPAPSMAELAKRTLTDPSSVSVVVRRLREAGFLACTPSPEDARRVRIGLTRKGEALARSAPTTVQASLITALHGLPAATRRSLARGLGELVEAMGVEGDVHLFFEDERGAKAKPESKAKTLASRKKSAAS